MFSTLNEELFISHKNNNTLDNSKKTVISKSIVNKLIPDNISLKQKELFSNKKFLILVQSILDVIKNIRPNKSERENIYKCKQFLSYFFESSFYKWKYRTIEMLKIKNLGISSENIYKLKYGSKWENKWLEHRKRIAMTLENQIKKYGIEEGTKRWKAYCKKQSETNTFEYKNKKYGMTREEFDAYNKSRAATLENMILRYGTEQGIEKWNQYCEKQKYAGCALEYFQEKYGKEEGLKHYNKVNSQKRLTEESFIRKYGKEEGIIKFKEYLTNFSKHSFVSKSSQKFFEELYTILPIKLQKDCYYSNLNREYLIHFEHTTYLYDFTIPSLKYCIEFNGDYWHANPAIYNWSDIIRYPQGKMVEAQQIWTNDAEKILALKKYRGYDVDIIWESEYLKNPKSCVEDAYEKIMQRYKLGIE